MAGTRRTRPLTVLLVEGLIALASAANPLVSEAGQTNAIPNWDFTSSAAVSKDVASLSKPGLDTTSWHHVDQSRCTVMGCMIDAGLYKDDDLWFSHRLNSFDWGQFLVPWIYRHEFSLAPKKGQHFLLQTNGVTSRADLYLNGNKFADKDQQAGSFGGHIYDVTSLMGEKNALAANVYPANFNLDLVYGFVDWNPHAPDNGSGIWRDVTVKQTGPVALGPLSVSVDIQVPVESNPATVTVRAEVRNLENREVQVDATSVISESSAAARRTGSRKMSIKVGPRETKLLEMAHSVQKPKIWWPKFWGGQPLYKATLTVHVANEPSDLAQETFGIRTVTSALNSHNDTMFTVNGHPFQVIGGGYSPDMFMRWDPKRWSNIVRYSFDMGLNTIRLEGMMEHPELYRIADEAGMMIIAGYVCCSKWESWSYNGDLSVDAAWVENDYKTANATMRHEAAMMQPHPSVLGFLVGSDYWPNDRATRIYVDAMKDAYWQTPIIASASKRGYPALLGPSGMKMDGPYDWVPPNYWYDTEPSKDRLGAAFGFGSELGAGVGTPEMSSLKKFMTRSEMEDLWKKPDANHFHMSTNTSSFYNRKIYNEGLFKHYGPPTSLEDYIYKAQLMDYEAIRAQHEGYSARWNQDRPATGTIYWMLNNAWPSLHWNQFDHYLHPAGSYFGTKVGSRLEHVAYDYVREEAWIINHSLDRKGTRHVSTELIDLGGKHISNASSITIDTVPNKSSKAAKVSGLEKIKDVGLLRLVLADDEGQTVSRNVYWLTKSVDALHWSNSTWYHTPVTKFADFSALGKMKPARLSVKSSKAANAGTHSLHLENRSGVPAFFIRLNIVNQQGRDVNPAIWSDNYVTLWPKEKLTLTVTAEGGHKVLIAGGNIGFSAVVL